MTNLNFSSFSIGRLILALSFFVTLLFEQTAQAYRCSELFSVPSDLTYSGLPGELKTDLLLRLNAIVVDHVAKYGAGAGSMKHLKLGEAFYPFLSEAASKLTLASNEAPVWREFVRIEIDVFGKLWRNDNTYISLTYSAGRLTALMSMMEDSPDYVGDKNRVNNVLDAEGKFMAALVEKLFERGVLILPTVGHYSEGDSVRSWGSGIFQYGIFVDPDAGRFGNKSSSTEFRDHDLRHIRDYLAKFGQPPLSTEDVLNVVADYRRNILTAEELNRSIQALNLPVRRVAYTALYTTGHEQNIPLEDFPSRQQIPHLALLNYFTQISQRTALNLAERRQFYRWWRKSISSEKRPPGRTLESSR